jgi:hypothetical protein
VPQSEKTPVPTHLKVIIAIGVIGFLGTFALLIAAIFIVKENFGPEHAAKVAKEIVDLPDPLPAGWQYGVGIDVGYQKIVNVQYKPLSGTRTLIQFSQLPYRGTRSGKEIASKFVIPKMAGMAFEPDGKGEEAIGGKKAYYVREHCSVLGRESAMEVAFVDLPDGTIMQVQSSEYGKTKFDPELVKPLLDSVKGFASGTSK